MTQDFDSWLGQVMADDDDDSGSLNPNWRPWLQAVFEEWGPISQADVEALGELEADRLLAIQLDAAQRLLPAILADGQAVGMTLDVVLRAGDFGRLEVTA